LLAREYLKDLLSNGDYTKTDKLLICLAVDADVAKEISAIRNLAEASGLRAVKGWNVSQLLSSSKGLAVRTDKGWELTSTGKQRVQTLVGPVLQSPIAQVIPHLRALLPKVTNPQVSVFIEEAVRCLELGLLRSAVVLSWVGAVAVLYDHIISNHLAAFNSEAVKKFPKWKDAKTADDFSRMQEADFLIVIESAQVIGKSIKQELEGCLKYRNAAGHPNQLKVGVTRATAHVETLILHVFSVYC
jgi:hypothetical protein